MYPSDRRYTKEHEWVSLSGAQGRMGVTDYAQKQLGDVVFVELPEVGRDVKQGQACGTIESVKAVSELYSPVTGEVTDINDAIDSDSGVVNRDPYGDGWMVQLRVSNPAELKELMSPKAYRSHIGE
jgi:glycine cleavage system H protein